MLNTYQLKEMRIMGAMLDKVFCEKDVVMRETGEVAFTKGKTYKARFGHYIIARNNSGEEHCIATSYGRDSFFNEHFSKR
jgi:hypothetical protein